MIKLIVTTFVLSFVVEGFSLKDVILQPTLLVEGKPEHPTFSQLLSGEKEAPPPERFFHPTGLEVDREGNLYVADTENQRIVKFSKEGKFLRQIDRTDVPWETFAPLDLAFDDAGRMYVLAFSRPYYKVAMFDEECNFLRGFDVRGTIGWPGIAIDSQGLIYLNVPDQEALFSVYSKEGEKVDSFGEITRYDDPNRQRNFNSVVFCFDKQGFLNVLYKAKPIFRRYDKNHRLVFEKEIEGEEIEIMNRRAAKLKGCCNFIPYFLDIVPADDGGVIAKLSTWRIFYWFDRDGNLNKRLISAQECDPKEVWIERICIDKEGNLYGLSPVSSRIYRYAAKR